MTAYLVVHVDVTNQDRFSEYTTGSLRTIRPYKGWILAAGGAELMEESEFPLRSNNVILSFPTMKQLQAWWGSQEYKDIIPIRVENSKNTQAMSLPGLDFDADVSGA